MDTETRSSDPWALDLDELTADALDARDAAAYAAALALISDRPARP